MKAQNLIAAMAAVVLVLVAFGLAGADDFKYEQEQADRYCDMVRDGVWPNYKNREC